MFKGNEAINFFLLTPLLFPSVMNREACFITPSKGAAKLDHFVVFITADAFEH
jgi:hypothetical protein